MVSFIQKIRIVQIQLIHGRYSKQLAQYCMDNNITPPYHLCYVEDPLEHLMLIFEKNTNLPTYKSDMPFAFENIDYGTSLKLFKKKKGLPTSFCSQQIGTSTIVVFGYKTTKFSFKGKALYYFIDKKFVMGEYMYNRFGKVSKQLIAENVLSTNTDKSHYEELNFYIENPHKQLILLEDTGFSLCVKYFDCTQSSSCDIWKTHKAKNELPNESEKL